MEIIVIDGHNVLGALGQDGRNEEIDSLIVKVKHHYQGRGIKVVLVFDNHKNQHPTARLESAGKLEVYFSDPDIDSNADDRIERYAQRYKSALKTMTFVTNDRELKDRLRFIGAHRFLSSEDFLAKFQKRPTPIRQRSFSDEAAEKEEALKGLDKKAIYDELLEVFTRQAGNR